MLLFLFLRIGCMQVVWTEHAKGRFFERSLKYGASFDEAEYFIIRQKVRLRQAGKKTVKTVFSIGENYFTAVKEETKSTINVVSVWESNEKEVDEWKKRQSASSAREKRN